MKILKYRLGFFLAGIIILSAACQKTGTVPSVAGVAAFTVINAIPHSNSIIPVINTSAAIMYFRNAERTSYGRFFEYSPPGGDDTVYVLQRNSDTLNVGPKTSGQMFYNILPLKTRGIYSLFLCGTDTTAPDYLFTTDTLPYHSPTDSTVGIRFVNLSTGSNPVSINLEGSANGSEVASLSYKGITGFRDYLSNSTLTNTGYVFVIRDAASGDSLTSFSLTGVGTGNGIGLEDPLFGNSITFKNVTIALIGQPGINAAVPQSAIFIDDY